MKHVFVLHSHTTMLTSLGVMDYYNLKKDDVVFFYGRNYSTDILPSDYNVINISDLYLESQMVYRTGYKKQKNVVDKLDKLVDEYVADDFYFYIPNFCVPLFVAIYTNKHCKEARYIQEGGYVQSKVFRINYSYFSLVKDVLKAIKFRMPFRLWIPCSNYTEKTLYKQRELHSYALSESFFMALPSQRHVIKWPKIELDLQINQDYPIFITDGFINNLMAEKDVYYEQLERLIGQYHKSVNYVKFHPAQSEEEKDYIKQLFVRCACKCIVLPDKTPMELVIVGYHKLTFIGMGSSLLYFAEENGHFVISHDDWMLENSQLYRRYVDTTGAFLFKEYYNKK